MTVTLMLHRLVHIVLHRCFSPEDNILSVCGTLLQCNMCLRIRKVGAPADALTAVTKAEADVSATGKAFCEAKEVQALENEADALAAGAKASAHTTHSACHHSGGYRAE